MITVYAGGQMHYAEHQTIRGYKSSVEDIEHFGLGKLPSGVVDSVAVVWPGGKRQVLRNIPVNQIITVRYTDAIPQQNQNVPSPAMLSESHQALGIQYQHKKKNLLIFSKASFFCRTNTLRVDRGSQ